jgi:hypothetical protein
MESLEGDGTRGNGRRGRIVPWADPRRIDHDLGPRACPHGTGAAMTARTTTGVRASWVPWVYRCGARLLVGDGGALDGLERAERLAVLQCACELLVERDRARSRRRRRVA